MMNQPTAQQVADYDARLPAGYHTTHDGVHWILWRGSYPLAERLGSYKRGGNMLTAARRMRSLPRSS